MKKGGRMFNKISVRDIDSRNKRVFLRVDFNVPLDDKGNVQDDLRIREALKTINCLIENKAIVIIASHMGRPKGKVVPELSLKPCAKRLSELLGKEVKTAPDCIGDEVEKMASELKPGDLLMLENLRFHKEETDNDAEFARKLSKLAELYVNDAFGAVHRAHASVEAITHFFQIRAAGFLIEKELEYLGNAVENPKRPFVVILGGAKVSGKLELIINLMEKCDTILLGGAMVYTFLASRGRATGSSLVESDKIENAGDILKKAEDKGVELELPLDHLIAKELNEQSETKIIDDTSEGIPAGWMGVDIGPKTVSKYSEYLKNAKTIVWNGPMGVFEIPAFAAGTLNIARAVAASGAISIVGGGDSAAAVKKAGVTDKLTHISTGGGASLEFLAGEELPGIKALSDKK
jgi:phosphoglycerate kinase